MAFRDYVNDGSSLPEVSDQQQHAPPMVPLSLELVPPVLCQSFGVPMQEFQLLQRNMLGYNVQNALRQRGDMFRFGHAEQYPVQHYLGERGQMPYQAGHLPGLGQMAPFMYGLSGDAVGFAQQAYGAGMMQQQYNAMAQQQRQQQQAQNQHLQQKSTQELQKAQHKQSQQPTASAHQPPQPQPVQHGQLFQPQFISAPTATYLDSNLFRSAMMHHGSERGTFMATRCNAVSHRRIYRPEIILRSVVCALLSNQQLRRLM
jgi:hypothetical protein